MVIPPLSLDHQSYFTATAAGCASVCVYVLYLSVMMTRHGEKTSSLSLPIIMCIPIPDTDTTRSCLPATRHNDDRHHHTYCNDDNVVLYSGVVKIMCVCVCLAASLAQCHNQTNTNNGPMMLMTRLQLRCCQTERRLVNVNYVDICFLVEILCVNLYNYIIKMTVFIQTWQLFFFIFQVSLN